MNRINKYALYFNLFYFQVIDNNVGIDWNIRFYILILALPLIPLGIIRPLKYLVPFSALATAFIMFGLGVTLYYTFSDLPPITSRPMFSSFPQLPLFFSTVIFAMEGIGTVSCLKKYACLIFYLSFLKFKLISVHKINKACG